MGNCFSSDPKPAAGAAKPAPAQSQQPAARQSTVPTIPEFGLDDHFQVIKSLGEGGSGETWLCLDRRTGEKVAIKFIKRPIPKVMLPMVMHEIKIQADLGEGHVNLVQAKEVLLTPTHLCLIMEYADGGNLTAFVSSRVDTIEQRNGLFVDEDEARYFFKQSVAAVEYLHRHHVAHRDLKLDNVVLLNSNPPRVKLCDFGFAKNWGEEASSTLYTQIGTPVYMSPQQISSKNTKVGYDAPKADVWACGVLLFVMLLGMFPFDHTDHPDPNSSDAHVEVWLQQIKGKWRDSARVDKYAKKLSPECIDLLDQVFELDEKKRIDIDGIKAHPWFNKPVAPKFREALENLEQEQQKVDHKLKAGAYQSRERDKQLYNLVLASGMTPEEAANSNNKDLSAVMDPTSGIFRICLADTTAQGTAGEAAAPNPSPADEGDATKV